MFMAAEQEVQNYYSNMGSDLDQLIVWEYQVWLMTGNTGHIWQKYDFPITFDGVRSGTVG
jgi:hypothetical protein